MPFKEIKLNDGRIIPQIGFGTWKIPQDKTQDNVLTAIDVGFDHIDTAQVYGNELQVGAALKETGLKRSDVWVTTKWSGVAATRPAQAIKQSLDKLGLEYVDLYLIHSPRLVRPNIFQGWSEMVDILKKGQSKSIGVSNFLISDLQELESSPITPAVNQILLHPYVYAQTKPLIEYCAQKGIVIEAYSPLVPLTQYPGGPVDKPVYAIAERLGVAPEQVLLAWIKSKGAVILTTSSKKERLERYQAVADIDLTDEDIEAIELAGAKGPGLARFRKYVKPVVLGLALQGAAYVAYRWLL
ncbi:oxidoreductase [Dacryopinax primogenitus]|uniref:Oxidoreductase n=1 Tax=Dacryopinax primogenitus (strain DJM 731) TaxID=1858805 RepID=M5G0J1_DACPD|nr:oxidoreductase [Dacryopinax primogenitus]EJU02254.1 oxidoreductase [Dacryopinax primogenitus]